MADLAWEALRWSPALIWVTMVEVDRGARKLSK